MIALLVGLSVLVAFIVGNITGNNGLLNVTLSLLWAYSTIWTVSFLFPQQGKTLEIAINNIPRARFMKIGLVCMRLGFLLSMAYFGYFVLFAFYVLNCFTYIVYINGLLKAVKDREVV